MPSLWIEIEGVLVPRTQLPNAERVALWKDIALEAESYLDSGEGDVPQCLAGLPPQDLSAVAKTLKDIKRIRPEIEEFKAYVAAVEASK